MRNRKNSVKISNINDRKTKFCDLNYKKLEYMNNSILEKNL